MRARATPATFLRRFGASCSGAALIEFTLVLPLLMALALGVAEFGRLLYQYQLVSTGVRDAGRYLSRLNVTDPVDDTFQANAKNLATTGSIAGGTLRVPYWDGGDITVTATAVDNPVVDPDTGARTYRGGATIYVVRVDTTVSYADLGFLAVLGLGTLSYSLHHEERVIGE